MFEFQYLISTFWCPRWHFFSKAQSELKNVSCKSLNELTVKFYVTLWVLLTCQHFTAQRKAVLLASYKGNAFKWMDVTDKLCHSWKKEKEMLAKMKKNNNIRHHPVVGFNTVFINICRYHQFMISRFPCKPLWLLRCILFSLLTQSYGQTEFFWFWIKHKVIEVQIFSFNSRGLLKGKHLICSLAFLRLKSNWTIDCSFDWWQADKRSAGSKYCICTWSFQYEVQLEASASEGGLKGLKQTKVKK